MSWDWPGRGNRHAQGYGVAWTKLRTQVLKRDGHLCQVCAKHDRITLARDVDHIVGKAHGGTDDPSNLQAICRRCHNDKTTRDRGGQVKQEIGVDGFPLA